MISAAPVLAVRNIRRVASWYGDLGFSAEFFPTGASPKFCILRAGDVEIMLECKATL